MVKVKLGFGVGLSLLPRPVDDVDGYIVFPLDLVVPLFRRYTTDTEVERCTVRSVAVGLPSGEDQEWLHISIFVRRAVLERDTVCGRGTYQVASVLVSRTLI